MLTYGILCVYTCQCGIMLVIEDRRVNSFYPCYKHLRKTALKGKGVILDHDLRGLGPWLSVAIAVDLR